MPNTSTTHSGTLSSLWRYPVKSMLGEPLTQAEVTTRGLVGDRIYAVLDQVTGKIASAKHPRKWGGLLACRASYLEGESAVRITLPNSTIIQCSCDRESKPDTRAISQSWAIEYPTDCVQCVIESMWLFYRSCVTIRWE